MKVLIDANVLLRVAQPSSSSHRTASKALVQLHYSGHELCLVPQSIYEYWVVATRPVEVNGLGLGTSDMDVLVKGLLSRFTLLPDERGIFECWHELVVQHNVQGKLAHDTRLVAAMKRHGLKHLLTINKADFTRFTSIQCISPDEVNSGADLS